MDIIADILLREGGFVDHPSDKGGPTNMGITLPALSDWLGRPATVEDLKALTAADARAFYTEVHITKPGFGVIPNQKMLSLVVDMSVNHGLKNAVKMLQRSVGVEDDGVFGEKSKAAVQAANYGQLYLRLCAERGRFYGRIITKDPSQSVFAKGWMNRLGEFIEQA